MKLDLKLLSVSLSQLEDEPPVPIDGVDPYLLEKVLRPCMDGADIRLRDMDFDAFDAEDIDVLEGYYNALSREAGKLRQFTGTVQKLPPEAHKARRFC